MRETDWIEFLGRFHPLLVHLPIGMLLAVFALELYSMINKGAVSRKTLQLLLTLSCIGAVFATAAGLLLAWDESDYNPDQLCWHRLYGIAMTVLSLVALMIHHWGKNSKGQLWLISYRLCLFLATTALVLGSHYGAMMTHGTHYLTRYAPWNTKPAETAAVIEDKAEPAISDEMDDAMGGSMMSPDMMAKTSTPAPPSLSHQAVEILNQYCVDCHGPDKQKGRLRLDTEDAINAKGKSRLIAIIPGNADESEVIKRMVLPLQDDDRMPPEKRTQPEKRDLEILIEWINSGAEWSNVEPSQKKNEL